VRKRADYNTTAVETISVFVGKFATSRRKCFKSRQCKWRPLIAPRGRRRPGYDEWSVSHWVPRAAVAAVVFIVLIELLIVVPARELWIAIALILWTTLPGIVLARFALGGTPEAGRAAWLVGPALGFGFSVFGLLLVWAAGLQSWLALVVAPLFTLGLGCVAPRLGGIAIRLPALDRRDVVGVCAALLVVPTVTFAPYMRVAERTADGEAYRAYFTADFVWAMTVTAELAKGDVPPANPFLSTQPMRYYWMSHLLSGAIYRTLGKSLGTEKVVLTDGLAFGLAFVAFVYWLIRASGGGPVSAAVAVGLGFLANSYEGFDRLWAFRQTGEGLDALRYLNIDAITRWVYNGMPVDGLQRLLLYQPHHLTGYVLALSALWLVGLAQRVSDLSIALWAGILLALAFLFSTFSAIMLGVAVGILFAVRLVQQRTLRSVLQCAILGAAPVAVGIGISAALGYTDPDEGVLLRFGFNPVAFREWPYVLFLSFGPLLLAGLVGLCRVRWLAGPGAAAGSLVLTALAFYFTADVPDMGGVWVGWRSGHMLLIAFSIVGAAAFTAWWHRPALRLPLAAAVALAAIPALPTVMVDVYNAQDTTNRKQGPTFPWTLVITPPEREALTWVRRATPADAIVQVEAYVRDSGTWAYVPAFAERRMAAGLPISMIPLAPYRMACDSVRDGIFRAHNVTHAHAMARHLSIDYLLVGTVERENYAPALALMAARPDLFRPVFANSAITVYAVTK
jgi:hypothetical protein